MGASLDAYKVATGERSNFAKFDGLIDTLEASLGAVGDPSLNGFGTGLILDPNQLKQGGATNGQTLIFNGTLWVPTTVGARTVGGVTTPVDIVNTTTQTDLITGLTTGFAIPAAFVAGSRIRFVAGGDYLNNSGAGRKSTLTLGNITTWSDTSPTIAASATRHAWMLRGVFQGLTNVIGGHVTTRLSGSFVMSDTTAATTGVGALRDLTHLELFVPFVGNPYTAVPGTDRVQAGFTHPVADPNLSMRILFSRVEVLI